RLGTDQHAWIVLGRIRKRRRGSHRNLRERRNAGRLGLSGAPPPPVLEDDPELPDDERQAGEHQELHEIAPPDVSVLGPIDRKILAPRGLRLHRSTVGRRRDLFAVAQGWVPHVYTCTSSNGSAGARTMVRARGRSLMAAVTSTYGARAPNPRGII